MRVYLHALCLAVCVPLLQASFLLVPNPVESRLAELIREHPQQNREEMNHHPVLHLVARSKAEDLARRNYWSHTDPDGYGPNQAARLAGYSLPSNWLFNLGANQIEALAAGYPSAEAAFAGWLSSPGHRSHVLGEIDFFRNQVNFAVGYSSHPNSAYIHYYVFISAPLEPNENSPDPYRFWLFEQFTLAQIDGTTDSHDFSGDGLSRMACFVLDLDPWKLHRLPTLFFNPSTSMLQWLLPTRQNTGSVQYAVEWLNPANAVWSKEGVLGEGFLFSLPVTEEASLLRLRVWR